MAKISQIKLTNTTYDIDVASNLKATKIIGEDPIKIPPVEAIQKPDGVNPLFDENNKISSHYINDIILGQLKFGGTLTSYNFLEDSYAVNPSQLILSKLYELTNYPEDADPIDSLLLSKVGDPSFVSISMLSGNEVKNGYGDPEGTVFEGFYFISAANLSDGHAVGDWLVINNKNFEKIDNTDTITHIDETEGDSLLEITGTSGLKLSGIRKNQIGIELTSNLYTQENGCITCGGSIYGGSISGGRIAANSKMTAPTITDKTDKSQVINLEYFENNATKVDWENIDSEVHVINDHNVEIDGGLVVHGGSETDILEIQTATSTDISSAVTVASHALEPDSAGTGWTDGDGYFWHRFPIKARYHYAVEQESVDVYGFGPVALTSSAVGDGEPLNRLPYRWVGNETTGVPAAFGTLYFTADITGYAYVPFSGEVLGAVKVVETSPVSGVKVDGDLEVTGDLSFGAESHLVFGTIEGTDFIADYAKVKNAPVEDDDVVNKAYFDANKGSSGGGCVETVAVKASEGLVYELTGDEYSCTGIGTCTDTDIVIAAVHNGLPVTSIGDFAFSSCSSFKNITIPDSVTSIGEDAFQFCLSLTSIEIPDSVTSIGACAFDDCFNLTSIEIPDSVTSIGARAFDDCLSLTSIEIPDSVTSIGEDAFFYCESLTIYCEADYKPKGWHNNWNPDNRPVVWGAALSIPAINDKLNNGGNSDISNYQGNAKINGNLEVTGNLSFDGDLEMSSIEAQSIKINGKRVLTEDDLANLVATAYKNANEEVY